MESNTAIQMAEIFFIRLNNAIYIWKYENMTPYIYLIYSPWECKVLNDYLKYIRIHDKASEICSVPPNFTQRLEQEEGDDHPLDGVS